MSCAKNVIQNLLSYAGVNVGGENTQDIQVYHESFYPRVLKYLELGLGEAYMDEWFNCKKLDHFFTKILSANLDERVKKEKGLFLALLLSKGWDLKSKLFNLQTKRRAFQVGEHHYDRGNDLFEAMLDSEMNYTCGYWRQANNLKEAQYAKVDLVCQKLNLKAGMKVLDIGCGWGAFAKHAATHYGVSVVGVTISKEQAESAKERCKHLPIEIRLQDYRDLNESFDHIVSLGMFEHVGRKNYHHYMMVADRCLKQNGLFLLHTIGLKKSTAGTDRWINKYIFPNGVLPTIQQIAHAVEGRFVIEDLHNFGADYDKTLVAWHQNFTVAWDRLQSQYSERFRRMWEYYLLSCAALFRVRHAQLWQIVLSRGVLGGYYSVR